jgi:L-asparaginase
MRLALIYSGGTIGCDGEPLDPLPVGQFQRLWARHIAPRLDDAWAVDWQWPEEIYDSSQMTPADWARLTRLVLGAREEDAVLMLHGTDTMAWSAAAISFLLTLFEPSGQPMGRFGLPIVLTGAQRPLFDGEVIRAGTDGLDNLLMAIDVCRSGKAETVIAFGGEALPATRVMKMSTTANRAFDCPTGPAVCPPLAKADARDLAEQLDRLEPHLGRKAIANILPTPSDADFVVAQLKSAVNALGEELGAIYLNCYGIGTFPAAEDVANLLCEAHDRGVLVVAGSQVPFGDVDPSLYGAGHWLAECGAIPVADMATPAAHVKLHLAMALGAVYGWQQVEMERFFLTPVAGELRG